MQISITKHSILLKNLNQSVDLESVFSSTLPVQRRTFLAENKFLVKNHVSNQKSQIFGIFKRSVLDFKDTSVRLCTFFQCDAPVRGDKLPT